MTNTIGITFISTNKLCHLNLTLFIIIVIPFASLKAQNVMKYVGIERIFYYSKLLGITVNYKSRGGEWAAPTGVTA